MFSIDFLHKIRSHELNFYKTFLPEGSKVLEIGGGTGIQAKQLSELGLDVTSVDVSVSIYADKRVYPIIEYDGKTLPFSNNTYDIVFSSNVLEHVLDLDVLHDEFNRVLKADGYSIHAMPSATWRLWSTITHYIQLLQRSWQAATGILRAEVNALVKLKYLLLEILRTAWLFLYIPPRHGETGNCITELYTFSRYYWKKHFRDNNYVCMDVLPMSLFYTGYMILGERLSLRHREILSRILGSSCILYRVKKI